MNLTPVPIRPLAADAYRVAESNPARYEVSFVDLLADGRNAHTAACIGPDCAICGESVSEDEYARNVLRIGTMRNTVRVK